MTTRRIGEKVGSSTMTVYSAFGSLGAVVGAVVEEGFAMLDAHLVASGSGEDALADIVAYAHAYRGFALAHPHLFRAMYATAPVAGHLRTGEELLLGLHAFTLVVELAERAIHAGTLRPATVPAYDVALAAWNAVHGAVLLELAGYPEVMPPPTLPTYELIVRTMLVGAGADARAVDAALSRRS
jgi:AcrR family transcriptional regulator